MLLCALVVSAARAQDGEFRYQPRYRAAPCRLELPRGEYASATVFCGRLTVPEDRESGRGLVHLSVIRLRARGDNPAPDPILYLAGGPGGNASGRLDEWLTSPLRQQRDIYLLDQRGTGYSRPALACENARGSSGQRWAISCLGHLYRRGANPIHYTSADSAADVRDLRLALGIDEWNLIGVSYGSRLALTVLRDYPQGVRAVILDSVFPPQVDFYAEQPANGARALRALYDGCAAEPACAAAFPELESLLRQSMRALNEQPLRITLPSIQGAPPRRATFNGADLFQATFRALYNVEDFARLPLAISELRAGNADIYADLIRSDLERDSRIHDGMYYAVQCAEEAPFTEREALPNAVAAAYPPEFRPHVLRGLLQSLDVCSVWPTRPVDAREQVAVYSETPALLLSGEYDPITPPRWAEQAAETLPASFSFTVPGIGHGVIRSSACGAAIAGNFLAEPTRAPERECLTQTRAPLFEISER